MPQSCPNKQDHLCFENTKKDAEHGKEEHDEAEELLIELTNESLTGAAWFQKFQKLKKAMEHHIEEEEQDIFPDAQSVLDEEMAQRIERRMETLKNHERQTRSIEPRERDAA